jgi:hypothetical protein
VRPLHLQPHQGGREGLDPHLPDLFGRKAGPAGKATTGKKKMHKKEFQKALLDMGTGHITEAGGIVPPPSSPP